MLRHTPRMGIALSFHFTGPRVEAVDRAHVVDDVPSSSDCSARASAQHSHNTPAFHRPLYTACGSRGKPGQPSRHCGAVFQNSSFAQLEFRKPGCPRTLIPAITSEEFPHFLRKLRVLLVFIYISICFSLPVAALISIAPVALRIPESFGAGPRLHSAVPNS